MTDSETNQPLNYSSPAMIERRRRILRETRHIISESGYDKFSIRALAKRSNVAQRTLYNAFGSKENIVCTAIAEYQKDFDEHVTYEHPTDVLEGLIERIIKVHSRNLQIRSYAAAVMATYNAQSSDPIVRQGIREIPIKSIMPLAIALRQRRQLAKHISPEDMSERYASSLYSCLTEWTLGNIQDTRMIARMVEAMLMVVLATTRGKPFREAVQWLDDIRGDTPRWQKMFSDAALRPKTRNPKETIS